MAAPRVHRWTNSDKHNNPRDKSSVATEGPRLLELEIPKSSRTQLDRSAAASGYSPRRPVKRSARRLEDTLSAPPIDRLIRIAANLIGAAGAALFAQATLRTYLQTHQLIGPAFFAEQMWVVIAYLIRRPARVLSRRMRDWFVAFGGTFGGVLFRPDGAHLPWGLTAGLVVQLFGLALCVTSFLALGRSFGFVAADRGLVQRGPYALVRHPIYASYLFLQAGYLLQSISIRNALVMVLASGCNVGRAMAEDRVLATNDRFDDYRRQVPWRLIPGVW
jgi:protein-S-isoprenylcysteine O-methyltransferase Ste14